MRRCLAIFILVLALGDAALASSVNDRRRERELRLLEQCQTFSAALYATTPESFAADLSRFVDASAGKQSESDYYWRSRSKRPEAEAPVCDGSFLHRAPPRFPVMCGSQICVRVLPYACAFVSYGVDANGATTNVKALRHFPEGNSRATRMLRDNSLDSVRQWCFPTDEAPDLIGPDSRNVSQITYKVENNPLEWEFLDDEEHLESLNAFYAPLSRQSCADFVAYHEELSADFDNGSPSSPAEVTDAESVERAPPQPPAGTQGNSLSHSCVVLRFAVDAEGATRDVEAVFSAPSAVDLTAQEGAAIEAARTWRYRPATRNGAPVEQSGLLTVLHFENSSSER